MKCLQYLWLLLALALTMAACSNDSFKIDGILANFNGKSIRVIFLSDSGVVDEWTDVDQKGKFTFEGHAALPVLVSLLNRQGQPLTMLVAKNGDHLKVKGDASKAMGLSIKGNRLNEDWQIFRNEHKAFYTDANPSRLDAAIEKYVRDNPDDMLSTVLTVADYSDFSDRDKVNKMLKSIHAQARPESLTGGFAGKTAATRAGHMPRLMTLTLFKDGTTSEEIKLTGKTNFIHLWTLPQDKRSVFIQRLQGMDADFGVIDVRAESDTMSWHQTIANDPGTWKHYWAPAGPLEQGIQLMGVSSLPWYAVTDSTGLVVYSGPSLDAALNKVVMK